MKKLDLMQTIVSKILLIGIGVTAFFFFIWLIKVLISAIF